MMHQPTVLPFEQASETASPWVEMATGHLPAFNQPVVILCSNRKLMVADLGFHHRFDSINGKNTWRLHESGYRLPVDKVVAWMPISRRARPTP
jgi:hypothetical protein